MSTFNRVRDAFYSESHAAMGDPAPIHDITFLIDHHYLTFSSKVVARRDEYEDVLNQVLSAPHEQYVASGGGYTHVVLKILAGKYVQKAYDKLVRFEQPFCGFYPDVLSEDKHIVVECGHTQNPEKILAYFKEGGAQVCIQIPYPDVEGDVIGFHFTANDDLHEFLNLLAAKRRKEIKRIFSKRSSHS